MGITRTRPAPDADEYAPPASSKTARDDDGFAEESEDTPEVTGGWGAAKKVMASTSTFTDSFKFPDKDNGDQPALIKFPEAEPFASYEQHWVDEITSGKKSWTCLKRSCALCARGHKTRAVVLFNVIDVETGTVAPLEAGPMLVKVLETANEGRTGPLNRHYYEVFKTGGGKKGKVAYTVNVVKASELAEDFGLDPDEVAERMSAAKLLDSTWVKFPKADTLKEIAEEYLSD
jgi:hypothetical protein